MQSTEDPGVWMRPVMKDDGFQYLVYALCCVYELLNISHRPLSTMKVIQSKFKWNNDNTEELDIYLRA